MSEEILEKLHRALLIILEEVDRVCRENGIEYFLDSGTALGAVRHGGFIPWDDDADVGMTRDNYEKFLVVAERELKPQFYLQTHEKDPGYLKFNAKIRLNNTFFPEEGDEGKALHRGIFVDLFPFDYTNLEISIAKRETKRARLFYKLWVLQQNKSNSDSSIKRMARKASLLIPEQWLVRGYRKQCSKYKSVHDEKKLTCYSYKMNDDYFLYFDPSDMETTQDVQFENKTFRIMKGYDNYLKIMFGDYLSLPPVEKRVSHFKGDIDFGNI